MSARLQPQHCPADHDLTLNADEPPACSAGHVERRDAVKAAGRWLEDAANALAGGTLRQATCPHPDGSGRNLRFNGVDPQCLAVVLALGRVGRFDADVAYIGLCAQQPSGRWQGLAGAYVWLCSDCGAGEPPLGPRQLQADLAQGVPSLVLWEPADIPAELAWGPGWWDERWIATYGLGTSPGDLWHVRQLSEALAPLDSQQAALLRLGEQWTEASILMLATAESTRGLYELLAPAYDGQPVRSRRGPLPQLAHVTDHETRQSAAQHWLNVRQGPPPEGPLLLRLQAADGSGPILRFTQQPRRLSRQLVDQGSAAPANVLEVWSLPRLLPGGVINGDALVALHQQLAGTTAPA